MAVKIQIVVEGVISVPVPDLPERCELKTEVLCFVTCGKERRRGRVRNFQSVMFAVFRSDTHE